MKKRCNRTEILFIRRFEIWKRFTRTRERKISLSDFWPSSRSRPVWLAYFSICLIRHDRAVYKLSTLIHHIYVRHPRTMLRVESADHPRYRFNFARSFVVRLPRIIVKLRYFCISRGQRKRVAPPWGCCIIYAMHRVVRKCFRVAISNWALILGRDLLYDVVDRFAV